MKPGGNRADRNTERLNASMRGVGRAPQAPPRPMPAGAPPVPAAPMPAPKAPPPMDAADAFLRGQLPAQAARAGAQPGFAAKAQGQGGVPFVPPKYPKHEPAPPSSQPAAPQAPAPMGDQDTLARWAVQQPSKPGLIEKNYSTEARPQRPQGYAASDDGLWVKDPQTGEMVFVNTDAWAGADWISNPYGHPSTGENVVAGEKPQPDTVEGAAKQAVIDALNDPSGLSEDELAGMKAAIDAQAAQQASDLSQLMSARGLGASGLMGVGLGGIARGALDEKGQLDTQAAMLREEEELAKGALGAQVWGQGQELALKKEDREFLKQQWDQALKDQDEADFYTLLDKTGEMLGADGWTEEAWSAAIIAFESGMGMDEFLATLHLKGGKIALKGPAGSEEPGQDTEDLDPKLVAVLEWAGLTYEDWNAMTSVEREEALKNYLEWMVGQGKKVKW